MSPEILIRPADAQEVISLRHAVLRAGLPRETAIFAGDDHPETRHFVATLAQTDDRGSGDGRIVACVTLLLNAWEGEPAWQLRGMAVEPGMQGGGIGQKLLAAAEQFVLDSPARLFWCNARVPASEFYRKHGWRVVSDVFDIPTAGPHVKMLKRLTAAVR